MKKISIRNTLFAAAFLCLIVAMMYSVLKQKASQTKQYVEIQGYAQGGIYSIKCSVQTSSANMAQERAQTLKTAIDSILNVVDYAVSGYNKSSLISRYNRGEYISDDGSPEYKLFTEITAFADSICIATDGVVDSRAAALFDVWGFGFKSDQMPSEAQVEQAMKDRSKLNFNAIAQGYSADLVAAYLREQGVEDMLVNIGGEMVCDGVNPQGKAWRMAIDKPVDGNNEPGKMISGTFDVPAGHCGVVTSGNYRKFYIKDGVKYSHSVDPRTGYPVRHSLSSATIIAPTSALSDAFATYCMVLGAQKAKEFIQSRPDIEGCLITSEQTWTSSGLKMDFPQQ